MMNYVRVAVLYPGMFGIPTPNNVSLNSVMGSCSKEKIYIVFSLKICYLVIMSSLLLGICPNGGTVFPFGCLNC